MRYAIENEPHWHSLRANRTGASDVPILDGCGYMSPFTYWHQRKGLIPPEDFSTNERVILGRNLEAGIASAAAELWGYKLAKSHAYYTDDAVGQLLGATPDYFLDEEDSDTVVEVKNCSYGAYKDDWIIHDDGFVECPLRFQLQVQAQLACTGANNGILIALISGDRVVRCFMPRHEAAIEHIRTKVSEFQASLDNNTPPPAEMPQDFDTAKRVWLGGDGFADLRGDPQVEEWLKVMAELRAAEKLIEADITRVQGEVLQFCTSKGLAAVTANNGKISCKKREAQPAHARQFRAQPERMELRITTR